MGSGTEVTPEEAQALINAQANTIGQQQARILLLEARVARYQAEAQELQAMLVMLREAGDAPPNATDGASI